MLNRLNEIPDSCAPAVVAFAGTITYQFFKSLPHIYNFVSECIALNGEKYSEDAIAIHNEASFYTTGFLFVPLFLVVCGIVISNRQALEEIEALEVIEIVEEVKEKPNECENMLNAIAYPSEKIPRKHCCPISYSIMSDPVIAMDGHTYDRDCIAEWLKHHSNSPMENLPLENNRLIPNKDKKSEINDFIQNKQKKYYGVVKQVFFERSSELKSKDVSREITESVRSYLK